MVALLITGLGIALLVVLISSVKLHAFLAFLLVSLGVGLALGLSPEVTVGAIQEGIGSTLGAVTTIIALGAMLGKMVAQSGAAQRIALDLMALVGVGRARWAFMVAGFLVGLPLFYSVGFLLLTPLVIAVSYRYRQPAVYLGLPMLAALSVTQGYLPPHPAPLAILNQFGADLGLTLGYGILVAIPAILVSGLWFGSGVRGITTPANPAFQAADVADEQLPSSVRSFGVVLLPIGLISVGLLLSKALPEGSVAQLTLRFVGEPVVSMLLAVLLAIGLLRPSGEPGYRSRVRNWLTDSVKEVALLFLIFGGAGALKQVLTDGGLNQAIAGMLQTSTLPPYVLGWGMAALIRVCVGSSTVAGITTAGFVSPLLHTLPVDPNLMVLAIGAGSMMFSHVNDTGFWLFREYFQLSMKDTLRTWSVMETLVSIMGLLGVLALSAVLG